MTDLTYNNIRLFAGMMSAGKEKGMVLKLADLIESQDKQIAELKQNCAFYKCCALSGETPKEGSEPFPEQE